eukprot:8719705-Pyramimonas_sp.AAC.1
MSREKLFFTCSVLRPWTTADRCGTGMRPMKRTLGCAADVRLPTWDVRTATGVVWIAEEIIFISLVKGLQP